MRVFAIDLALRKDRVALVIGDITPTSKDELPEILFSLAERLRPGATEPEIKKRVCDLIGVMDPKPDAVLIDSTGLGKSMTANIRRELKRRGDKKTRIVACDFRGEGQIKFEWRKATIPKSEMYGQLLSFVEHRKVKYAPTARESDVLHKELDGLRVAIKEGRVKIGNDAGPVEDRTAPNDDLATAAGLVAVAAMSLSKHGGTLTIPPNISMDMGNTPTPSRNPNGIDGATADALRAAARPQGYGRRRSTADLMRTSIASPDFRPARNQDGTFNLGVNGDRGWPDRRR